MKIADIVNLIRLRQWYKNLLVFIPLIFSKNFFSADLFLNTIFAFFSLSFISSSYYIFNDIIDLEKDKLDKQNNRPLATGVIKSWIAKILMVLFFLSAIIIAVSLSIYFMALILSLFVITALYTVHFKNIFLVDAILIATNFVIRAISGVFIINIIEFSPWIIISTFFLALVLIAGKRKAEAVLILDIAHFRPVSKQYTSQILNNMTVFSSTILFVSYTLYAALEHIALLITLPVAFYLLMRYMSLTETEAEIAKNPEKCFRKKDMLSALILWIGLTICALYLF